MKQVTRDINPKDAQDLLERVPHACLSYASADGPQLHPVRLVWKNGRYWVALPEKAGSVPEAGQEAVLLVDEGIYYFELRAIYIRGTLQPVTQAPEILPGHTWLELVPTKTVAWDYGAMREVTSSEGAGEG